MTPERALTLVILVALVFAVIYFLLHLTGAV